MVESLVNAQRSVVAVDLGAESGRVVLGHFDGRSVRIEEAHRFPNSLRLSADYLRWDFRLLMDEIRNGLNKTANSGYPIASVGVDAWGLDYGYLDSSGRVLDDPISYRDHRTDGALAEALRLVGRQAMYGMTGIQLMEINTVVQLMAESRSAAGRSRQRAAKNLLMIPDLIHHEFSGSNVTEETAASSTGAYDVVARRWAVGLLRQLDIPTELLPEVVRSGTDVGSLLDPENHACFRGARVIVPGSHDTASAVVGVPFAHERAAFISSGTWSLVGVEVGAPIVNEVTMRANLSNERGVAGTVRLLRNVMGLWLLQECRRQWSREGHNYSYEDLGRLAESAPSQGSLINPNAREFRSPGDMPARIRSYCTRTGQSTPESVAEVARCVLESLAMSYKLVIDDLESATGCSVPLVHVVGGGSKNDLLNRLTADVVGVPVHAGPVEATSRGNVGVQLCALGEIGSLKDLRDVLGATERPRIVDPMSGGPVKERLAEFRRLVRSDLSPEVTMGDSDGFQPDAG